MGREGSEQVTEGGESEDSPQAGKRRKRGAVALRPVLGVALVLAGIGAVMVAGSYGTPASVEALGRNAPVNAGAGKAVDISAHNSPTIARDPTSARNLVVANKIDSPRYACALHTSSDGGVSWSQTPIPAPEGVRGECYAPDVAFGSDGTLYLTFVTLEGLGNVPGAVWLLRSRDGGETLSEPERVLGKLAFQVRLVADPDEPGRLYLTYLQASDVGLFRFTRPGNPIRTIRSDDSGQSWSKPARVSDPARGRAVAPAPAVGPDGELYVLYLDLVDDVLDYQGGHNGLGGEPYPGSWKLVLARSRDHGASWSESVVEDRLVPTERFIAFLPPSPSVAVDPQSGRVYAAFQDGRLGDPDVLLWTLPGDGEDWQGPRRVNDTERRDGTSQYLPKLSVTPEGRLDIVYYDRRDDPRNDVRTGTSFQTSFDEGATFTASERLNDRAFDSRVGFGTERELPDLGSRIALLSTDSRALAVWSDTRAGTTTTLKQDLAKRVVAITEPQELPGPTKPLLRWGGVLLALVGAALLATWLTAAWRYRARSGADREAREA
jgi:hypothetical protein